MLRWRTGLNTALEGLDDDHASATTGAWLGECLRFVVVDGLGGVGLTLRRDDTEQFARPRQVDPHFQKLLDRWSSVAEKWDDPELDEFFLQTIKRYQEIEDYEK